MADVPSRAASRPLLFSRRNRISWTNDDKEAAPASLKINASSVTYFKPEASRCHTASKALSISGSFHSGA